MYNEHCAYDIYDSIPRINLILSIGSLSDFNVDMDEDEAEEAIISKPVLPQLLELVYQYTYFLKYTVYLMKYVGNNIILMASCIHMWYTH